MVAKSSKRLMRVLSGERLDPPPLWMMRQAGRYLPEYRATRQEAGSFLDLCYSPKLATEVTLQPIRRFGFDAAILFSDILVTPHALGVPLWFVEGEGPKLEPIKEASELSRLKDRLDPDKVGPVYEAVSAIRAALPAETTLIGFVGAPYTVATYVVAGGGSDDHKEARLFAMRDPAGFSILIDRLIEASVTHLIGQIDAGADVVQIFDSWAGELPAGEFERWCIAPIKKMVKALKAARPATPIIVFPRAAGSKLKAFGQALPGVAIGLDTAEDGAGMGSLLAPDRVVQGNLDPLALIAGGEALERAVGAIRDGFRDRPHIFNLGHGIRPETPIAHVERFVELVRAPRA